MSTKTLAQVTLPTDTSILITRDFAAPRRLVYRAYTEPDLIARWWSAKRGQVTSIEVDLRVGGTWRYAMTANGGFEVGFHGEYREIVTDERLVTTEVFEGMPDAQALDTVTFTDNGAGTTLTLLVEHDTRADRDIHIHSGMEDGLQDALILMDGVLAELS